MAALERAHHHEGDLQTHGRLDAVPIERPTAVRLEPQEDRHLTRGRKPPDRPEAGQAESHAGDPHQRAGGPARPCFRHGVDAEVWKAITPAFPELDLMLVEPLVVT